MILTESGLIAHKYFYVVGVVLLILFLIYVFFYNHITEVDTKNDVWYREFTNVGLTDKQIHDLTHDDNVWYYQGISTCVGYGDWNEMCPKNETYCAGKEGDTFGDAKRQAYALRFAISKGGEHPDCPLVYKGTN